jgi:hypothetical protein
MDRCLENRVNREVESTMAPLVRRARLTGFRRKEFVNFSPLEVSVAGIKFSDAPLRVLDGGFTSVLVPFLP